MYYSNVYLQLYKVKINLMVYQYLIFTQSNRKTQFLMLHHDN
jgi:hypothetical protein